MNLIITGPVYDAANDEAREWLPRYIKDRFTIAMDRCVRECAALPPDPWNSLNGNLEVMLWPNQVSDGSAGLFWPSAAPPGVVQGRGFGQTLPFYQKVEVNWAFEMTPVKDGHSDDIYHRFGGHDVMIHEFQHMGGWHAWLDNWAALGHGHANDPLRIVRQHKLDEVYHGDMRLVHVGDRLS